MSTTTRLYKLLYYLHSLNNFSTLTNIAGYNTHCKNFRSQSNRHVASDKGMQKLTANWTKVFGNKDFKQSGKPSKPISVSLFMAWPNVNTDLIREQPTDNIETWSTHTFMYSVDTLIVTHVLVWTWPWDLPLPLFIESIGELVSHNAFCIYSTVGGGGHNWLMRLCLYSCTQLGSYIYI